jgi:hypothetical protein
VSKYEPECVDPEIGELLVDHASGRLGHAERARFAAHLECCLACSEQLAPMVRLMRAIGSLSADDVVAADPAPQRPTLFGGAAGLVAVAAAVALLLVALVWQRARDVAVVREMRELEARLTRLERQGDEILRAVDGAPAAAPADAAYGFVVLPNL